jgi:hypothetical protein
MAIQEAELAQQREVVSRREADLLSREQALVARERRIAEQQRVMSEEYRLLRQYPRRTQTLSPAVGTGVPASPGHTGQEVSRATSFRQRLFQALGLETGLATVSTRRR